MASNSFLNKILAGFPERCFQCLLQEACSLQYYFLVLWKILGVLPPSKAYIEQLKCGNGDPSESDILHTLRWSSRLRVSTYVNWIKVCVVTVTFVVRLNDKLL